MAKFRGTVLQCAKDYGQRIKGNFTYRDLVARALGVNSQTPGDWFDKLIMPKGINLLKLQLLLELAEYELVELPTDPITREFGKLLALELITLEDAMACLGVSYDQGVYRLVFGKTSADKKKISKMRNFVEKFKDASEKKLDEWKIKLMVKSDDKTSKTLTAHQETTKIKTCKKSGLSHKEAIVVLAYQMKAILPLAQWLASDEFTSDERRSLRELFANGHTNNVFELSNVLNRLCSETARKEMK